MSSRPVKRGLRGGTFHTAGRRPANPGFFSVGAGPVLGNGGAAVGRPPASRARSRAAAAVSSKPVRSRWINGAYNAGRVTGSTSTGTIRPAACWAKAARSSEPPNVEMK
jgi:hypothetical protein